MRPRSRFDHDTAVTFSGEAGRYTGEVRDGWAALGGMPNGGYVLGLCMQTLGAAMPQPDPLVVSAFFMRPAILGPADLDFELLHEGRRHATGGVSLIQEGREIVRTTATFTDLDAARGRTLVLNEKPSLPPPDECLELGGTELFPGVSIVERFTYRVPEIPGWVTGNPSGHPYAEFWISFADRRPIDTLALPSIVDAAAPVVVELGESSATVELTIHVRARPAPGPWLACRVSTRHIIDGYHEEEFEVWDEAGDLVAQSRQLALLPSAR